MTNNPFEDLFVLEIANNHWGSVDRGLKIIHDFAQVVRYNNVRAALKLQFRCPESFVHKDFRSRTDIRYVKKTIDTAMSEEAFATLVTAIRAASCVPMATPFDERSVDMCERLGLPILKLASSDVNDWPLIERVAATRKPVLASTGGSSQKDVDDLVTFFERRDISLALNHCVSLYPTEDSDLELNQIDFLRNRYPGHVIGFSTHEYNDWSNSIMIAYAKGARTFERHVDIEYEDGKTVSPYCSLPFNIDAWFKAWRTATELCGNPGTKKRRLPAEETKYLDLLVRGVYAKRDLEVGEILREEDFYLAVPLQKGQLSCRELMNGQKVVKALKADAPIKVDSVDGPYGSNIELREKIERRGL